MHVRGLPEFHGAKISWAATGYADVRTVQIAKGNGKGTWSEDLSFEPDTIGGGGNSGFQALNLALQWGARRIIFVGLDMVETPRIHWYGRNNWPMANNPDRTNFKRWIANFDRIAPTLQRIGADVVNASPNSAVKAFRKASIEQALSEWS